MERFLNQEKLPEEVRQNFFPYLSRMLERHGSGILSVSIYGSAAGGDYRFKKSDINSIFIFQELSFETFKTSLNIAARGKRKRISAPLFLTREYISSSADVFPIEFLDMKENHICVYGEDILSSLQIKHEHLRLLCEQQIKGKLLRIRQAYLEIGIQNKQIEGLLKESGRALIPVFRNLIRLKGKTPPVQKTEIIKLLCSEFQLREDVLGPVLKWTRADEKISRKEMAAYLEKYLEEMTKLAKEVDKL